MTALFSTRRRADQFAAALDGAADAAQRDLDLDRELRELLAVTTTLRSSSTLRDGPAAPRAEFAEDLRSRLMTEAEQVLTPGTAQLRLPQRPRGRRERRLVAAASAVVLLGGTASMAAAAQDALPGEALYPIKRGIERAEAGLSMSPGGKGLDLLHQANDRLSEVEGLLAADAVSAEPQIPATLADFTTQAEQGADLLMAEYQETRDPANIAEIREFTTDAIDVLRELARTAPDQAQDELASAALTIREIDAAAVALCGTCAPGVPALQVPDLFLLTADVNRRLDELSPEGLDNSHPVEVDRGLVARVEQARPGTDGKRDGTKKDGARTPDDATEAPGIPGTPNAPDSDNTDPGLELPETDLTDGKGGAVGGVTDGVDSATDPVGDALTDVTDGLTGTVETILPDPDTGGGLLR